MYIYMGKLYYFTNLNLAASYGDDFPKINHDFQGSVAVRSVFLKGRCLNLEFINNNPSCINHIPFVFLWLSLLQMLFKSPSKQSINWGVRIIQLQIVFNFSLDLHKVTSQ